MLLTFKSVIKSGPLVSCEKVCDMHYFMLLFFCCCMVIPGEATLRVRIGNADCRFRMLPKIHHPAKLPVWPVVGGVFAQISDWMNTKKITENILDSFAGRVVPVTLSELNVSPFLLLAHHSHSFAPLDPFREFTKFVLPEGFPAHPHSGFSTVTYCIDGGLRHRDSEGIKMSYGNGDVQWMRAGRGTIHEEMWDVPIKENSFKKIEIFQLWVNLPAKEKLLPPKVTLLRKGDIPVHDTKTGASIRVICGTLETDEGDIEGPGNAATQTPVGN